MTPNGLGLNTADAAQLYSAFGLVIASQIPLPELPPCQASLATPDMADLVIRLEGHGQVPKSGRCSPYLMTTGVDEVVLIVPDVARYRIRTGREVVIDAAEGVCMRKLRLFLLGSALGIACHQRGLFPLHANAISVGSGAVAFVGDSGTGKSTLAAYFQSRGFDVLCDDVCVIDVDGSNAPLAWPGLRRLNLWRDALQHFGHQAKKLTQVFEGLEKYQFPLTGNSMPRALPLLSVYVLERVAHADACGVEQIVGKEAVGALVANTYRNFYLPALGLSGVHFLKAATLAGRINVFKARRRWGYDIFAEEAGRLERHISSGLGYQRTQPVPEALQGA